MERKIIDLNQYKSEHFDICFEETYKEILKIMKQARPRRINIGEPVIAHEYHPDGIVSWELEGSLKNIAAYITSNDYGKIFYDFETKQPLFCARGKILHLAVSKEYYDELKYALEVEYSDFYHSDHYFLGI